MATSTLQIRVDSELRKEADKLFALAGLDMSSAVRLFLRQSVITVNHLATVLSEIWLVMVSDVTYMKIRKFLILQYREEVFA